MNENIFGALLLFLIFLADLFLLYYIRKYQKKSEFTKFFSWCLSCILCIVISQFSQLLWYIFTGVESVYFEYFSYIGLNYLPIFILFAYLALIEKEVKFNKYFLILFVMPIINLLLLWTNDYHHLFFNNYSIHMFQTALGPFYWCYEIFTDSLYLIEIICLFKTSFISKKFFSKQSFLLIIAIIIPIIVNKLGLLKIIPLSIYSISITFSVSIFLCAMATFKYNIFNVSPMALAKIMDSMSDSYIVLDKKNMIIDYNKTFLLTFDPKNFNIKNINFLDYISGNMKSFFGNAFNKAITCRDQVSVKFYDAHIDRYFIAQITPLLSNDIFVGTFVLFKDITQHEKDIKQIKQTQENLIEAERLSSLGQLIGGIAHNLNSPIMSISGAAEGLSDLVNEYESSITDPDVNINDHYEIANDMKEWIKKIKNYTEYMSDIISTVKGQAVTLSETTDASFSVDELVKRINILMKHELKNNFIYLNVQMNIDNNTTIHGNINNLVQVLNNMISNSIQAYDGKREQNIDLIFNSSDKDLIITVRDYGPGIPEKIKDRIFNEMITTKGKNGTGIGLYLSYSTIKAHFNGDITFETDTNKGTSFYISLPM